MKTTENNRPTLSLDFVQRYLINDESPLSCGGHYNIFHEDDSLIEWDFLICLRESIKNKDFSLKAYSFMLNGRVDELFNSQLMNIVELSKFKLPETSNLDLCQGMHINDIPSKKHLSWAIRILTNQRDFILGYLEDYSLKIPNRNKL